MQPHQNTPRPSTGALELRRTSRMRQADRFEISAAASEAEDICPIWITDRLSEREQVSP